MKRKILALVMDLAVAAALLGGIYGVNYMIPQKGVTAQTLQASASGNEAAEAAENTGNSLDTASGEQNNAAGQSSREQQLQALLDGNRNGTARHEGLAGQYGLEAEIRPVNLQTRSFPQTLLIPAPTYPSN